MMYVGTFYLSLAPFIDWYSLIRVGFPLTFAGMIVGSWRPLITPQLSRIPAAAWLMLAALLVRLPGLIEPLWYDETFTAGLVSRPLADMWQVIQSDVHPPGWYLIEWFNVRLFGYSEAALRLPSLIAGLALIPLTYRLAIASDLGQITAAAAAVIIAFMPGTVYYSGEARSYSLLAVVIIIMMIAVLEDKPRWFAVAAPAAVMLHNLGYFHVLVIGLAALAYHRQLWRWSVAIAPAALVGLCWLPFMLSQAGDVADGFWLTVTPAATLSPLTTLTVGDRVANEFILHITAAIVGLSALALIVSRRWIVTRRGVLVMVFLFGVPALAAAVSFMWRPVYLGRAFLSSAVVLVVVWSYALTHANTGDRFALRIIVVPMLALALVCHIAAPRSGRGAIVDGLQTGCSGADMIYNTSIHLAFVTAYYSDLPQILWVDAGDINQELSQEALAALDWQQAELADLSGAVCVLDFQTLLNKTSEREYMASIIPTGSDGYYVIGNTLYSIYAHLVQT